MVNQLIQGMIAIVIGLALLPVVTEFVDELTRAEETDADGNVITEAGAFYDTAVGALIELLPVLYVIVIIVGVVGFIYTAKR